MAALRTRGCTVARKLVEPGTSRRPMHDRFHLVSFPLTRRYGNDTSRISSARSLDMNSRYAQSLTGQSDDDETRIARIRPGRCLQRESIWRRHGGPRHILRRNARMDLVHHIAKTRAVGRADPDLVTDRRIPER